MARKPPLTPVAPDGPVPLSYAQEGLWFLQQLDTADIAYTVPLLLRLSPQVTRERFEAALRALVERHEPLRTRITTGAGGLPVQCAGEVYQPDVAWHERVDEQRWQELLSEALRRPFALTAGRLVRGTGVRLPDGGHRVCLAFHHIVADGWSLQVIARDLAALYAGVVLPPLAVRYADFVTWERGWSGEVLPRQLAYWRAELAGSRHLRLPTDYTPGPMTSAAAGKTILTLSRETTSGLLATGREQRATGFVVIAALFAALLHRWSGESDVLLGTAVAGRNAVGLSELVGHFVNTVALRVDFSDDPSFRVLLPRMRRRVLDALRNADAPFHHVVAEVSPRRDPSRHPLFNVVITHQEFPEGQEPPADAPIVPELRQSATAVSSHFDLDAETVIRDGQLAGMLLYRADVFRAAAIERLRDRMALLAQRVVREPDTPLSRLDLLSGPAERAMVTAPPPAAPAPASGVPQRVAQLARQHPQRPAVATSDDWLTYGELDTRSRARADQLRAQGIGPGSVVTLAWRWDAELIVESLAVMWCGAAVTIQDCEDPPAGRATPPGAGGAGAHDPGAAAPPVELAPVTPELPPAEDDPALHVATPEGPVMLTHADLLRQAAPGQWADRMVLLLDRSPLAPWQVLAGGGSCLLPGGGAPAAELSRHAPSAVLLTCEQLAEVVGTDPAALAPVDEVLLSGDPVAQAQVPVARAVQRVYQRPEGGGAALAYRGPAGDPVALGKPFAGTAVRVLDGQLRPVPPGMVGELYLAGESVAAGYLDRPRATAQRFLPDPFGSPGGRMFRTGERVYQDENHDIVWLARRDPQVTVAGDRVDLAAVERVLGEDPRLGRVVVAPRTAGGRTELVAFVSVAPASAQPPADLLDDLAEVAARRLRRGERPQRFVPMPDLPAEVDRQELVADLRDQPDGEVEVDPARAARYEQLVAEVWERVLGTGAFTVTDSFFDVGGHSLLALPVLAGIRDVTGAQLPIATLFAHPTVRELARAAATHDGALPPLRREADRSAAAPLSYGQEALWLLEEMGGASVAYHVPMTVHLPADTGREELTAAVAQLVRRHESLRTSIGAGAAGAPQQRVGEPYVPQLTWHDLSATPEQEVAAAMAGLFAEVFGQPLALGSGQLVRGIAVRHPAGCTVTLVFHHIAVDGWSRGILARELRVLLEGGQLPPPGAQMVDFARWQRDWLTGDVRAQRLAYWRAHLAEAEALVLPADRRPSGTPSPEAGLLTAELDPAVARALRELTRAEQTTMFAALAAAVSAHLCRYTGQPDVVFGTGLTGRVVAEMSDMVGLFANTVMLRAEVAGEATYRSLVRQLRGETMAASHHQDVPYELVVAEVGGHREGGRNPFSDMLFVHHDAGGSELAAAMRDPAGGPTMAIGPRFEVELHTALLADTVAMTLVYRAETFDRTTMVAFLDHLTALLALAVADPDRRLSGLDLSAAMPGSSVAAGSGSIVPSPAASVVALVEQQRARNPRAEAVVDTSGVLSYEELTSRANQLAWHLRSLGVGPGAVVAVCHARNAALVVALLGIMKAGAAYFCLDPTHPPRRALELVEVAGAGLLLTSGDLERVVPPGRVAVCRYDPASLAELPGTPPPVEPGPDDTANVIFTSGSTGKPKGVAVTHRGMVNLVAGSEEWIGLRPGDRFMQMSPLTFDVSSLELWGALGTGAATVAVPVDPLADDLGALYRDHGVTVAFLVPALLDMVVQRDIAELATLRRVLVGGDVVTPASFAAVHRGHPGGIASLYGPSETTVVASVWHGEDDEGAASAPVPIGRPVANFHWRVLDSQLRPVAAGGRGEIYLGGPGLGHGYVGDPRLTAASFLPDPAGPPGSRLYRTGDIGRLRTDGVMEYLGRADRQVKIRGFRIELGEIEQVMGRHRGVSRAAVTIRHSSAGPTLAGYYVPDPADPADPADVRRFLAERLPAYEVPGSLTRLAEFPLTRNGKLDWRALPAPAVREEPAPRAPATHLESVIAQAWSALLERRIGVDDDFFASGGHSLLVVYATNSVRERLGWEVPLRLLFAHPTVARYAAALREAVAQTAAGPVSRRGSLARHSWRSALLGDERRVDLYTPPDWDPARGDQLLVMFDGADFVDIMRAPAVLDTLLDAGQIPPTPALFISHRDWDHRNAELAAGLPLIEAVISEAVPQACRWLGLGQPPRRLVTGGASLGAAAAAAAAAAHPDLVGGVVALSGPLWWSPPGEERGWLLRRAASTGTTCYYLFAADGDEPEIRDWTGRFHAALPAQCPARLVTGPGGHTFATWEAHLPEALATTLAGQPPPARRR